MPRVEELKRAVARAIERHKEAVIRDALEVLHHPETGFREERTSRLVQERFRALGVPFRAGIALTGVKGVVEGGVGPGPTVAVLGELDSLLVPGHPHADPATGAAHACGHHAQIGMLLGVAVGLVESGVLPHLSGRVALIAVPAEEFIEVEFRRRLKEEGKLGFLSGKQEFLRLGEFDDVDIAMMCHTSTSTGWKLAIGGTSTGHLVKYVQFLGRAAHAGGAPWQGVNALNAAMLALTAINTQRETFRDTDTVRVHHILTKAGDAVNSIPADVRLEGRVRAATLEAVEEVNAKVDRCFKAGALAVGATVRITTLPGYLPLVNDPLLAEVYRANAERLVGRESVEVRGDSYLRGGSTDMGDLSHLKPTIHPFVAGATGTGHGVDYLVQDYDLAVATAATALAWTVVDLLAEGARKAREVVERFRPRLTRDRYLALQEGRFREEVYIPEGD